MLLKLEEILAIFPERLRSKSRTYFKSFHINRIKDFAPFVSHKRPPYRKRVTDFMLVTKGNSVRTKGLNQYELKPNTVFFIPAFQIRTTEFNSDDLDGYFCHFDDTIFDNKLFPQESFKNFSFLQYLGNPLINIPESEMMYITHLMEQLIVEYQNESIDDFKVISSILMALFYKLGSYDNEVYPKLKNKASILTQRYKNELMKHIYDLHFVADYADLLGVSQNYLNLCVKKTIGKTALTLLTDMQLIEAKSLLRQSEMNISEIGFALADKNPSDFSRFFKAKTGFTPREFRNNADF
ncbi:AraC family transcriptional regulator [Confluentibacter flavum]|uniref:AraC family transcriptional regulator n=2 Tax=Confluentibacter flavum TaxID=1909700 RepID=A0A2N3HHU1_9FLAO|nr:AraC family transcriptional regulator [Confluentibacter flavum]